MKVLNIIISTVSTVKMDLQESDDYEKAMIQAMKDADYTFAEIMSKVKEYRNREHVYRMSM